MDIKIINHITSNPKRLLRSENLFAHCLVIKPPPRDSSSSSYSSFSSSSMADRSQVAAGSRQRRIQLVCHQEAKVDFWPSHGGATDQEAQVDSGLPPVSVMTYGMCIRHEGHIENQ